MKKLVFLVIAVVFFRGCKWKDKCPGMSISKAVVQGHWKQDFQWPTGLFAGDTYEIVVYQDSFHAFLHHFDDLIYTHGCYTLDYTEYAKGAYSIVNDSLILLWSIY